MAEIRIYPTYQEFYDRIMSGAEKEYSITQRTPSGVSVHFGELPLPVKTFFGKLFYKERRPVICLGECDNTHYILAVNKRRVEDLGGKLGN